MATKKCVLGEGNAMGSLMKGGPVGPISVNDLFVCTYNESHVVSGGKYAKHLQNCRQMTMKRCDVDGSTLSERTDMQICPYNSSHHIHRSVMDKHIELCDSYYKHCWEAQSDPPAIRKEREDYLKKTVYGGAGVNRWQREEDQSGTAASSDTESSKSSGGNESFEVLAKCIGLMRLRNDSGDDVFAEDNMTGSGTPASSDTESSKGSGCNEGNAELFERSIGLMRMRKDSGSSVFTEDDDSSSIASTIESGAEADNDN